VQAFLGEHSRRNVEDLIAPLLLRFPELSLIVEARAPCSVTCSVESQTLPTVEEITGLRPGTFAHWARAHADALV
jgi:hypothetical protein